MNIEYSNLKDTPVFIKKENDSLFFIEENKNRIIKEYEILKDRIEYEKKMFDSEYEKKKKLFDEKKCLCGADLNLIDGYDFWGCNCYLDGGEHIKFGNRENPIYRTIPNLSSNWVALLIKDLGLKGKIKAIVLTEWFNENGYIDLCGILGHKPYNYGSINISNKKSKFQEKIAEEKLNSIFSKVLYQQCFEYLFNNEIRICIPDFICSKSSEIEFDAEVVYVVDCKLSEYYFDDAKAELYICVVEKFLRLKEDLREVEFCYWVDDVNDLEREEKINHIKSKTKYGIIMNGVKIQ